MSLKRDSLPDQSAVDDPMTTATAEMFMRQRDRLRAALEALPERVRALGGFQKFRDGEFWVSRDDVLRLLDEALNGGEAT